MKNQSFCENSKKKFGGGGRVGGGQVRGGQVRGGGRVGGGVGLVGGSGCCEQRIKVFVKIQKKNWGEGGGGG